MNIMTVQLSTPSRGAALAHSARAVLSMLVLMGCSAAWPQPIGGVAAGSAGPASTAASAAISSSANPAAKAEAEVRRVDAVNGRIQLRHGHIPNLDMPPMTMVFRVSQPALLEGLKEGDRIFFTAEKVEGAYTVTSVEKRP